MDFGLGLILSFTDNATAGINNAVNSLGQLTQVAENAGGSLDRMASLSALSVVSDRIGSSFLNAGGTILSTLGQIIGTVNTTGQTLMFAENQLNALYQNSGKTGKQVIGEIQEYAKTSMFEFENLIPAVTSLKSVGIEAFDSITSSTGEARYSLLDYASALASFAPQMKNAYGTGINAAIGAMREYIAEGNALSLKRGAGLDITGILGEDKGATIEERTRQVADLIETLNMMPMVEVMSESPMTKLSNMGDVLFQFKGMIADSGVYEAISGLIDIFADFVMGLGDEKLQTIAKNVSSALVSLIKPIEWLAKKIVTLADGLFNLLENNPSLAKLVIIGSAVAGVMLVLAGVALKMTSAFSGLSLMLLTMGKSFSSIGGLMKSGILKVMGTLLPLVAVAGLLALAWKNDFAGIKTTVTNFVGNLTDSFRTAKEAVNGSVSDLTTTLENLRSKDDFFSNLTIGIMQVMTLFKALAEAWNTNTLSEDTFLKAKELGILPLIEAILDLKYRFGFFKQGFIDGWNEIAENIKTAMSGFLDNIEGTALESLVDSITDLFEKLASGDTQAWYDFGKSFADFSAGALALYGIIKAIGGAVKILTPIVSIFQGIKKLNLGGVFGKIATGISSVVAVLKGGQGVGFFTKLLEVFRAVASGGIGLKDSLTIVFGSIGTTVAGIISFVGGLVGAFVGFFKQLTDGFSWFWEIIKWIGLAVAAVGAVILGICGGWVAAIVALVVGLVTTIIVLVKDNWEAIKQVIGNVAEWINQKIIQPIIAFFTPMFEFIKQLWNSFSDTVKNVVDKVVGFIKNLITGIKSIWDNIMSYVRPCIETFIEVKNTVAEFCSFVGQKISDVWTGKIKPILTTISDFFSSVFTSIRDFMRTILNSIWNVVSTAVASIWETINEVFTAIFDTIVGILTDVWDGIVGIWNGIVTFLGGILSGIFQTISNVFMGILNTIMGKHEQAKQNFSNAWNSIKSIVTSVWNGIKQIISSVLTTVVNVISTSLNGIKNTFSTVLNGAKSIVTNVFNSIKTSISNVMNGAVNIVKTAVSKLKNAFNFSWSLPHLKLPHISVTGGVAPYGIGGQGSLPKFSISWYKRGGIFDEPSVIGVGEAGTEAVVPLENNLGWIDTLSNMIVSRMPNNLVPTNTSSVTNTQGDTNQRYLTNNSNTSTTYEGDTDNSIIFNEGAIQVNVQNASDEEAFRLAKKILEYIKRQKELDRMMCYA